MTFDPDAPAEGDGLFGLPYTPEQAAVVVIPVPFEATASYRRGTKDAPTAILEASRQVDLHDIETGDPWTAGLAMEPVDPRVVAWEDAASEDSVVVIANGGRDPGDPERCARVDAIMRQLNDHVEARTRHWLEQGRIPAILGGDHSVPLGAIKAASERFPGLGVLHVDAHADLRVAYEGFEFSHASILYNVSRLPGVAAIAQVGIRDFGRAEREYSESSTKIETWFQANVAWQLAGGASWRKLCEDIVRPLPKDLWITFDIDGLNPDLCPETGTPVPGGLTWEQALVLLRTVGESGRRIVGFDLNEVGNAEWDAIVGARLLYKLAGWALATRP